jgi:ectoine hydroxylase-related dioxygenase (phytanoyl-CoA dioxygenase family)
MMVATALPRVLGDDEIAFYDEHGYVLVKGVLSRDEAEHYRRRILALVPPDLTIPAHWGANAGRIKPYQPDGKQSFETPDLLPLLCNERLYAAAVQLLGDPRLRSFDASLGITIRNDAGKSSGQVLSQTPHLDCSVPAETPFLFTLPEVQVGGCYYLTDVEPDGGGIHVMPGGHRWVEGQVRAAGGGLAGRQLNNSWKRLPDVKTVEVTGEAGDFALLHHLMPHAAAHNRRPTTRVAQFTRFTRIDHPHYPGTPAPEGRWSEEQLAAMTPLGRKLLQVDAWD